MGTSATQVRDDITRSRDELGETIGALELRLAETKEDVIDKVSPKRVWHRKTDQLRQRVSDVKGSLTGTTERMEDQVATSKSKVRGQAQELAGQTSAGLDQAKSRARASQSGLRQRAEDNPMAAGLVALGAGVLIASVLPPTPAERQAARRLRGELGPLQQRASEAGRQVADEVSQSAQGRLQQVKERASEAVEEVKHETKASSEEVKSEAKAATGRVKGEARSSTKRVKNSTRGSSNGSASTPKRAPRRRPVQAR